MSDETAVTRIAAVMKATDPLREAMPEGVAEDMYVAHGIGPTEYYEKWTRALLASGVVAPPAEAVAAFLRDAREQWRKTFSNAEASSPSFGWFYEFAQRWPGVGSEGRTE